MQALVRTLAALLMAACTLAAAQPAKDFPSRPIHIIVPFTPGSGSDNASRYFGEQMGKLLGAPFVIDNRPGGNGVIGLAAAKSAPADGYTIVLASNSPMAVNPVTMKDLPYDPLKDFRPLAGLTRGMNVFLVPDESPHKTLQELVAAARSAARPLSAATYSQGYQLALEWFASQAGVRFVNVPYKGQAPIMTDLMGRQLDFALVDMGGAVPLLKAGKLRALAVSSEARHLEFPDVPTVRESGFPNYVNYAWTSFYVRAQTPDDITARLSEAVMKVHAATDAKEYTRKTGGELMPLDAAQMARFQREEIERFRGIAEKAGIRPE